MIKFVTYKKKDKKRLVANQKDIDDYPLIKQVTVDYYRIMNNKKYELESVVRLSATMSQLSRQMYSMNHLRLNFYNRLRNAFKLKLHRENIENEDVANRAKEFSVVYQRSTNLFY